LIFQKFCCGQAHFAQKSLDFSHFDENFGQQVQN